MTDERKTLLIETLDDAKKRIATYTPTAVQFNPDEGDAIAAMADRLVLRMERVCDYLMALPEGASFDHWDMIGDLVTGGADFLDDIARTLEARGKPRPRRLLFAIDRCRDAAAMLKVIAQQNAAEKSLRSPTQEQNPPHPASPQPNPADKKNGSASQETDATKDNDEDDDNWTRNALPRLRPDDFGEDDDEDDEV